VINKKKEVKRKKLFQIRYTTMIMIRWVDIEKNYTIDDILWPMKNIKGMKWQGRKRHMKILLIQSKS